MASRVRTCRMLASQAATSPTLQKAGFFNRPIYALKPCSMILTSRRSGLACVPGRHLGCAGVQYICIAGRLARWGDEYRSLWAPGPIRLPRRPPSRKLVSQEASVHPKTLRYASYVYEKWSGVRFRTAVWVRRDLRGTSANRNSSHHASAQNIFS